MKLFGKTSSVFDVAQDSPTEGSMLARIKTALSVYPSEGGKYRLFLFKSIHFDDVKELMVDHLCRRTGFSKKDLGAYEIQEGHDVFISNGLPCRSYSLFLLEEGIRVHIVAEHVSEWSYYVSNVGEVNTEAMRESRMKRERMQHVYIDTRKRLVDHYSKDNAPMLWYSTERLQSEKQLAKLTKDLICKQVGLKMESLGVVRFHSESSFELYRQKDGRMLPGRSWWLECLDLGVRFHFYGIHASLGTERAQWEMLLEGVRVDEDLEASWHRPIVSGGARVLV